MAHHLEWLTAQPRESRRPGQRPRRLANNCPSHDRDMRMRAEHVQLPRKRPVRKLNKGLPPEMSPWWFEECRGYRQGKTRAGLDGGGRGCPPEQCLRPCRRPCHRTSDRPGNLPSSSGQAFPDCRHSGILPSDCRGLGKRSRHENHSRPESDCRSLAPRIGLCRGHVRPRGCLCPGPCQGFFCRRPLGSCPQIRHRR